MKRHTLLITGANGYLGFKLAERFIQSSDYALILWMRKKLVDTVPELTCKAHDLANRFPERITISYGELSQEQPFETVDANEVTHIFHCAAITRFNVEQELADSINIGGTQKLLEFAETCPHLKHIGYASTIYSSGLRIGSISEEPHPTDTLFANHYERSKAESEALILGKYSHLPCSIYRIATVIADNETGRVEQFNVFHNCARLIYHGLLSFMPGSENTTIYLVTADYTIDRIFTLLMDLDSRQTIYHLCEPKSDNLRLQDILDSMYLIFQKNELFRRKNILKPLLTDIDSFNNVTTLVSKGLGGVMVKHAIESITPFAEQMFIDKELLTTNTKIYFQLENTKNLSSIIIDTIQYLVDTHWGNMEKINE